MISFDKINDKNSEYKMSFGDGKYIDLFLLPNKTLTNKFEIIISSIQNMSKVIGDRFDEFILRFLSDYQSCDSDENRYNLLCGAIEAIANFADFFIENNEIDYALFADESKKGESSIFFDKNEIIKIIKLSEAFKIYSLVSNSEIGLSEEYHRKIYNDLVESLKAYNPIGKIHTLLEMLSLEYKKTIWCDYDNLSHWSFIKVTDAFNLIQNSGLTICHYDRNPIPFFIKIFSNSAQWRDPHKENGIIYEDDDKSQNGTDDNILSPLRVHIDPKRLTDKNVLNNLNQISFEYLVDSYINQAKNISHEKIDTKLLKHRINQIEYISPFWEIIIAPILSNSIGVKYDYLLKQSPKKIAVISFYWGHQLKSLFNQRFFPLLDLSAYYPKFKVPESTTYRLKNISHLINSTLKYSMHDIHKIGGSRIKLVRLIEDYIGKMKTKTANYRNILTGKHMGRIDFDQIEEKTIDYLNMYILNNLEYEARELETIISKDSNITIKPSS